MATQESTDQRHSQQGRIDRIEERVAELLDPRTTSETQWVAVHVGHCPLGPVDPPWRHGSRCGVCGLLLTKGCGTKLAPRPHVVEHPPLLEQLRAAAGGSTAGRDSASGYESRPVVDVEAMDVLAMIEGGARFWAEIVTDRRLHLTVEELLSFLVLRLATMEAADLKGLDVDVLTWWGRARLATTWELPPIKPHVPCMACDRWGGLQVRLDPLVAVCRDCGAVWDSSTIGVLGEHIRIAMDDRPLRIPDAAPGPWPAADDDPTRVGHGRTPWHCACHGREHFPARLAADCEDRSAERATA